MKISSLTNGLVKENPTFYQLLGMCPTLAVTTSAQNGLGMGLATTVVLICSNSMISAMRKFVPNKIRIPIFVVIIATFVTIIGMLLKAFVPTLDQALGIFIPLIVVNCIILARAESFAFKNGVVDSVFDGIGMGLGFTWALTLLGVIREFLGSGKFFGMEVFAGHFKPALMMILPPGGFLTLGLVLAVYNYIQMRKK